MGSLLALCTTVNVLLRWLQNIAICWALAADNMVPLNANRLQKDAVIDSLMHIAWLKLLCVGNTITTSVRKPVQVASTDFLKSSVPHNQANVDSTIIPIAPLARKVACTDIQMNIANKCLPAAPMMTLNVILQLVDAIMWTLMSIAINQAAVDAMEVINVVLHQANVFIISRILLHHHSQMVHTIDELKKITKYFYNCYLLLIIV